MPLTSEIIFFFFCERENLENVVVYFSNWIKFVLAFSVVWIVDELYYYYYYYYYTISCAWNLETLFIQVKLVEPVRPDFWLGNASNNNKYDTRTGQGTAVDKSEHSSRIELSRRWRWGDHSLFRLYWYFYFFEIQQEKTQTNQENAGPLVLTPTPLHRGYLILWIVDAWWFI
jgi:hypothetical protein